MRYSRINTYIAILFAGLTIWLLSDTSIALAAAADTDKIVNTNIIGNGEKFDQVFIKLAKGFVDLARIIGISMTATGFIMWIWGLESFPKMAFNWILGIGLVMNFGALLVGTGIEQHIAAYQTPQTQAPAAFDISIKTETDGSWDFLSNFMKYYLDGIIKPGAANIIPISLRLLIVLTVIQGCYEVAFKLISGDKIKYMFTILIKCGMIIFLEENWIGGLGLMDALSQGFQSIGYTMANAGVDLEPDSIVNNAIKIWNHVGLAEHAGITSGIGLFFINFTALVPTTVLLFLTAIEMFMARIEFYTMALLVMPLLPFMITSKFSFLSDKAIGLVINLAIKVCAISFITAFIIPFFDKYQEEFLKVEGVWTSIGVILQMFLASLIIYKLTKSISNIVQGLMSGAPSLGGSMMTEQAQAAAGTALAATGNVMGARAAAGGFMKKGFLANIGKSAMINATPLGKGMDRVYSGMEQGKAAADRKTVTIFRATHPQDGQDSVKKKP